MLGITLAPYRVDYYNGLHDRCDCEIHFLQRGFEGQLFSNEQVEAGCTYTPHYLRTIRLGRERRIALGLGKILRRPGIRNVIVPEFSLLTLQVIFLKWFFRLKFNIFSQCDDSLDMLEGGSSFSRAHVFSRGICMPFLKDIILADSRAVRWYREKYGKGIWMPIIRDESAPENRCEGLEEASQALRRELGLEGVLSVLFVARLIPLKNLHSLLKACQGLGVPYRLLVVGDGPMRQEWEAEAEAIGIQASFLGAKTGRELDAIYRSCDVLVLPSFIEAFGAVTNEALLQGCRCVISNRAGSACLIEEGVNGWLCDPSSVEDIRNKILKAAAIPNPSRASLMKVSFNGCFAGLEAEFGPGSSGLPRILFIMHMPPPVHGAAVMGQYIHDSALVNGRLDCRYINLSIARDLKDVGRFSLRKAVSYLRLLFRIRREIREFTPDLVYVTPNTVGGPFYKDLVITQMVKSMGCKVVAHYHNKGVASRQDRALDDRLYRLAFRNQKNILLSERLYPDISRYADRRDVYIVPNGIPASEEDCIKASAGPLRILFLSNMLASKGVWTLLDALRILSQTTAADFRCDFVGEWKDVDSAAFRSRIDEYSLSSRVFCHGGKYGAEKAAFLREADVLVFPSESEAFGLVLLEAMQYSCACISTDEGGIPDIIDDGRTGFVVPKKDPRTLAEALGRLSLDRELCASMGRLGREKFLREFTIGEFERNFTKTLLSVLEES
ncbi:MAG: glycosyltransferase [Candidatus Cryptobacteroides sp.]